jgi:DNA-binding MarR family transcriptional regulator
MAMALRDANSEALSATQDRQILDCSNIDRSSNIAAMRKAVANTANKTSSKTAKLKLQKPPERPLQLFITYRLSMLSGKLNRQANSVLTKAGNLRVPEWRILGLLNLHGEMTGTRIADLVGVDPGLVSRSLRALEKRGLIATRRGDDDRRIAFTSLTAAGRTLHARVLPAMQRRQNYLLSVLTAEERATLLRSIDKLQIAAEARDFPEIEE